MKSPKASKPKRGETSAEPEVSTSQKRERRNWSEEENSKALDYLLVTIRGGHAIEKPNATAYYQRAVTRLELEKCTAKQLLNQVYNLKQRYMKTIEWRKQTGQGVLETGGAESLRAVILQRCPQFDKLDEIFGVRISISPPYIHDSSTITTEQTSNPINDTAIVDQEEETATINEELGHAPAVPKPLQQSASRKALKRKSAPESGMSALAETAKLRLEVQQAEVELNREKWQSERQRDYSRLDLEREQFEFEKLMSDRRMKLEERKVENELELAKFKIQEENKLKLELAKINR